MTIGPAPIMSIFLMSVLLGIISPYSYRELAPGFSKSSEASDDYTDKFFQIFYITRGNFVCSFHVEFGILMCSQIPKTYRMNHFFSKFNADYLFVGKYVKKVSGTGR